MSKMMVYGKKKNMDITHSKVIIGDFFIISFVCINPLSLNDAITRYMSAAALPQ